MRYVAWLDFAGHGNGAQARFMFKGKRYTKFFTDPKIQAMRKAHKWAMRQRKRLGVIVGIRSRYKRKTNTLPIGVTIADSRRTKRYAHQYYAKAYINVCGKQRVEWFSFVRYGKRQAIKLAIRQRRHWEKEFKRAG